MTISVSAWARNWTVLSERFHLKLSEPSQMLWFQQLSRWMSDEEFDRVVQIIWCGDYEFMPPPATFREIANGLPGRQVKAITAAAVEEQWGKPSPPPDWLSAWTTLRQGFKRRWPTANLALTPPNADQGTPAVLTLTLGNGELHRFTKTKDGHWCCDRSDLNQIAQEILSAAPSVNSLHQVIGGLS